MTPADVGALDRLLALPLDAADGHPEISAALAAAAAMARLDQALAKPPVAAGLPLSGTAGCGATAGGRGRRLDRSLASGGDPRGPSAPHGPLSLHHRPEPDLRSAALDRRFRIRSVPDHQAATAPPLSPPARSNCWVAIAATRPELHASVASGTDTRAPRLKLKRMPEWGLRR